MSSPNKVITRASLGEKAPELQLLCLQGPPVAIQGKKDTVEDTDSQAIRVTSSLHCIETI